MTELDPEKVEEILYLIDDTSYDTHRPTHIIVEELISVIWYLNTRIYQLEELSNINRDEK